MKLIQTGWSWFWSWDSPNLQRYWHTPSRPPINSSMESKYPLTASKLPLREFIPHSSSSSPVSPAGGGAGGGVSGSPASWPAAPSRTNRPRRRGSSRARRVMVLVARSARSLVFKEVILKLPAWPELWAKLRAGLACGGTKSSFYLNGCPADWWAVHINSFNLIYWLKNKEIMSVNVFNTNKTFKMVKLKNQVKAFLQLIKLNWFF